MRLTICLVALTLAGGVGAQAVIDVRLDQPIRVVPRGIFGYNLEWHYGGSGLWSEQAKAHYPDRLAKIDALLPGSLRYPGGTPSDYFHWQQAIGPEREPQLNPFYKSDGEDRKLIHPSYGPAEFLATAEALGAEAWITANAGTGNAEEAAAWARWCREQGHEVTRWEVGNEMYLKPDFPEGVALTAAEYVARFNEYADALRGVNPATFVCAIGQMPAIGILEGGISELDWNRIVIAGCAEKMDCLALHHAYAPVVTLGPDGKFQPEERAFRSMLGASVFVRRTTDAIVDLIREIAPDRADHISLAVTEHEGLFYPLPGGDVMEQIRPNRTLGSALYLATLYNLFIAEPKVEYAHKMTLITPVFGGVLSTTMAPGGDTWPNPHYWVCREYGRTAGQTVVRCDVQCETYSVGAVGFVPDLEDVPIIDASATRAPTGEVTVFAVNRSLDETTAVEVSVAGLAPASASATVLTGPSYDATNDAADALSVQPRTSDLTLGYPLKADLPPCSLTIIRLRP